ncbi:MAG: 50S ribosomal protein L29 [Rhizobacter sp.]|jgi:large subunit ribosomal protein L29|nr:50S ribosomal protein L29 [Burkholderiales bacterium]
MKTKDLTAKSAPELDKELTELYKTHFGLRMQKATQQLTNTSQLGNLRRDIARVKTVLTQKASAK